LRIVSNFRLLNKRIILNEITIPDMKETIEQLSGSQVYSLLNFHKAFNWIENTPKTKERLVVATEHGKYKCLTMSFEPTSTPGTFAKAMYLAFWELLDITAHYFDNVTVHSKNPKHHLTHLKKGIWSSKKVQFYYKVR